MNTQAQNNFIAAASCHKRLRDDLAALTPQLRAFSRALCVRRETAEDLALRTLMTAWHLRESLGAEIDLKSQLFIILRTKFYSTSVSTRQLDGGEMRVPTMTASPFYEEDRSGNSSRIENALRKLPEHQREALILIAAGGFSYAEVARIAGVQIGTIKSRVARGRLSLSRILAGDLPVPRQNKTTSKGLESSHPGGW